MAQQEKISSENKVRILKCSNPDYWYAGKVGEEFIVSEKLVNDFYFVKNLYLYGGKNHHGYINKNDCIKI